MPAKIYLSLGSNLGDRAAWLRRGIDLLTVKGVTLLRQSSWYETAPFGGVEQADFLNLVLAAETALPPLELLATIQEIEAACSRQRLVRWGPRTLDIDILLYGEQRVNLPQLQIPHPGIAKRAFVLVPLAELAPELQVVGLGTVGQLLAKLAAAEKAAVWPWQE